MRRLFVFLGVACLLSTGVVSAQRNPEPYDNSERKKSNAKADSTKSKKARTGSKKTSGTTSKSAKATKPKSKKVPRVMTAGALAPVSIGDPLSPSTHSTKPSKESPRTSTKQEPVSPVPETAKPVVSKPAKRPILTDQTAVTIEAPRKPASENAAPKEEAPQKEAIDEQPVKRPILTDQTVVTIEAPRKQALEVVALKEEAPQEEAIEEQPAKRPILTDQTVVTIEAPAPKQPVSEPVPKPVTKTQTVETVTAPEQTPEEPVKQPEARPVTSTRASRGRIHRAVFTNAVVNREPVDDIRSLTTETEKVFFFTEIVGMEGREVTHRWTHNDKIMAEVAIQVGGPRWRVYTSKKLLPGWTGEWTVTVVGEGGEKLVENSFMYVASTP